MLVADTVSERRQGLRDVTMLPDGIDGMLFAYDRPEVAFFTSEDTLMALDLWWFDSEGRLVGSLQLTPCESADCPSYASPGRIQWVLETPAGSVELEEGQLLDPSAGP